MLPSARVEGQTSRSVQVLPRVSIPGWALLKLLSLIAPAAAGLYVGKQLPAGAAEQNYADVVAELEARL